MQRLSASRGRGSRGRRTVPRQRSCTSAGAVDTSSTASLTTVAPSFGQALPTLEHVPINYNHEVNGELLYTLCAELVSRGLGTPDTWRKCGRNAVVFAQYSIMAAIGAERGDLLRRNVEYSLEISDVFSDGYSYGSDARVGEGKLCLSIACQGAGYLRIGPALDALEQEAAGLGAAFYWTLLRSLYRVMRIYDHEDATMYEENLHAYADEDDSGEQYEFPNVEKALPPYIAGTLDRGKRIGCWKLLSAHAQGLHGFWIGRLRTMERLSRLRVRNSRHLLEGNYDGPPLPSLILAFRDHDAIVAYFDEESQHMLESSSEPTLCVDFSPGKPDEVDQAVQALERFVSFNTELYRLAEDLAAWEEDHERGGRDRGKSPLRVE
jgi:hypothetical protein